MKRAVTRLFLIPGMLLGCFSLQLLNLESNSDFSEFEPVLGNTRSLSYAGVLNTLGFESFAASSLWLQFIQYYGHENRARTGYGFSPVYLESIIDLSPLFLDAYLFAPSAVAFSAADPEKAADILEQGIENLNPTVNIYAYKLAFQLASINFLFLGEDDAGRSAYYQAADWYEQAGFVGIAPDQWRELGDRLIDSPYRRRVRFDVLLEVYESNADPVARERILSELASLGGVRRLSDGSLEIVPPPIVE